MYFAQQIFKDDLINIDTHIHKWISFFLLNGIQLISIFGVTIIKQLAFKLNCLISKFN